MEKLAATLFGNPKNVLSFVSCELPAYGPNELLVEVKYAECNPVDLQKLRGPADAEGKPVPNPPLVVGYGGSGIVVQKGVNVREKVTIGARVAFMCDPSKQGSYATHVVVDHNLVSLIPDDLSFQEAASVPLSGCTALQALNKLFKDEGEIKETNRLLIVGAGGGVGSWATLIARARYPNLSIITTVSSKESAEWCIRNGASKTCLHNEIGQELKGGREGSVDYVLCLTEPSPPLFSTIAEVIRPYGSICLVVSGPSIKSLDLSFIFFKAATVTTLTVFTSIRTNFCKVHPSKEIEYILGLMSEKRLSAPFYHACDTLAGGSNWKRSLEDGGILDMLNTGHTRGKLVMKIGNV